MLDTAIKSPAKCVGCGYCCLTSICSFGEENTTNGIGGCVFLQYNGTRYICTCKAAMGDMEGTGCCSSFMNTWRNNTVFRGWVKK